VPLLLEHTSLSKHQLSVEWLALFLCFFFCCNVQNLDDVMTDLFWVMFVQVEPIRKAAASEVRHRWEKPLHEVHLQHRGCHGHEHGLQRRSERPRLPSG
jgi:hypothetical protein